MADLVSPLEEADFPRTHNEIVEDLLGQLVAQGGGTAATSTVKVISSTPVYDTAGSRTVFTVVKSDGSVGFFTDPEGTTAATGVTPGPDPNGGDIAKNTGAVNATTTRVVLEDQSRNDLSEASNDLTFIKDNRLGVRDEGPAATAQRVALADETVTKLTDRVSTVATTSTFVEATADGTVAAGASYVSIINTGTVAATIDTGNGPTNLEPDEAYDTPIIDGLTYPAITYTVPAGAVLKIQTVVR